MTSTIGPYKVEPTTQKVTRKGVPVNWGDKASQLFILLLSKTPKTITKEEIFTHVWKGRVVTENSLYKTISKLRKALNQDHIEIESVFGEGYRLTQTNKLVEDNSVTATPKVYKFKIIAAITLVAILMWFGLLQIKSVALYKKMVELEQILAVTKQAFISQINRRNELGELLSQRFELKAADSWEKRFYLHYDKMNEQERFICQQSRAYTEGPLYENNQAALDLLIENAAVVKALPLANELITHLTLWLNKYHRVFVDSEKMCLLYVGVEDGAKYPADFDQQLADWLADNQ